MEITSGIKALITAEQLQQYIPALLSEEQYWQLIAATVWLNLHPSRERYHAFVKWAETDEIAAVYATSPSAALMMFMESL